MNEPDLHELASRLRKRLATIADQELRDRNPEEQLRRLQAVSEEIDRWRRDRQGRLPARLNHFLDQASYGKALEWLEAGPQTPGQN